MKADDEPLERQSAHDREALRVAVAHLATLARCLDVDEQIEAWCDQEDRVAGGIAADALDQALGLLEELSGDRARLLAEVVERMMGQLPPPLE